MLEERESEEPTMNPFQKNESKETVFLPVSTEAVPPQSSNFPKKPSPVNLGIHLCLWQEQTYSVGSPPWPLQVQVELY